ncbi:MAG: DUF2303 family protein [Nitratireductor sp.]|nr:DUF2303 family protein [Nitratireductor sp.]
MSEEVNNTTIEAKENIAETVAREVKAQQIGTVYDKPDGGQAILLPGGALAHLDALDPVLPKHIEQGVTFDDPDSFCRYVNDFKVAHTRGFGSLEHNKIKAVIDYHDHAEKTRQYMAHDATLLMPMDLDWVRWRQIDNQPMTQMDFAYFLEEMAHTVAKPDAAQLMEIATDLKVLRDTKATTVHRLQDGTNELSFSENDQTQNARGRKIKIPEEIIIAAPVHFGGPVLNATAKFRYRMQSGVVHFIIAIMNRKKHEQEAFKQALADIETATKVPFLLGWDE